MLDGFRVQDMILSGVHRRTAHSHGSSFVSLVLEGSYRGFYAERERCARSGEAFFYEEGVEHRGDIGPSPARVFYVELSGGALIQREREALRKLAISPARRAGATSLAIRRLFVSCSQGTSAQSIRRLLRSLLDGASREAEVAPRAPRWLDRAQDIIIRGRARPTSLSVVADELGLSPTNMSRSFHKHIGSTVGEFLRRARIAMAAEELSGSDRSLSEIAQCNGFSDQSHMGRLFRQQLGVTPAAYRAFTRVR